MLARFFTTVPKLARAVPKALPLTAVARGAGLGAGLAAVYTAASYASMVEALAPMRSVIPTTEELSWYERRKSEAPRTIISSEKKEWLIIGRQSPMGHLVRDETKTPKQELRAAIATESSLGLTYLAAVMDNEKHYDLFPGSDFVLERITDDASSPLIVAKPEHMLSFAWQDIPNEAVFEVAFARKTGFADFTQKSPLTHSALAFREVTLDGPSHPGAVLLKGSEIKAALKKTDTDICYQQHCGLINSNCYSASLYATAEMIQIIHARKDDAVRNNEDILKLSSFLTEAAFDNLGQGVHHNALVRKHITTDVCDVLKSRSLLPDAPSVLMDEPDDFYSHAHSLIE